ncbi:exodeoxyribonuclease III [Acuticoccus sp. MNP-M23]|uniref:exodeoxyribonuclease III n=1 Tax=Acuticoccus sp. MNP-M23 TaxID=3072793 RepID=UPI002814CDAA|nr:exodeoxyribonuclease III [Acuticoccus sp. MNP-M23]WMS44094.1 exodeoxyribonuclease III [Acuticoccus sp. MNP-M23]
MTEKPLTVVTWNINSIRARTELFARMVAMVEPDVVLLQETRCDNSAFPLKPLRQLGFAYEALNGRGGHHGVAILSKVPLLDVNSDILGGIDHPRHVSALVNFGGPIRLHSLYIPAGGDEPDVETNPKFQHKLAFLDELAAWGKVASTEPALLTGDFNVAPYESDVWSHRQLLNVISHTPAETTRLEAAREAGNWVDVMRKDRPEPQPLYTWWSYRNKTWPGSNRGRRLDHIWASPSTAHRVTTDVLTEARGWEKASDHAPVIARIALTA